jgi:hypothetical protein
MLFRRLVILASLMFIVAAIMSANAPRRGTVAERPDPVPRSGGTETARDVVHGDLPKDKVVTAHVGDVIELTVRSKLADEAYVDGMGIDVPVEPDLPGNVRIVAERAGDFPVRLQWAGKRIGVLEVVDVR